jgi:hypothetical protein
LRPTFFRIFVLKIKGKRLAARLCKSTAIFNAKPQSRAFVIFFAGGLRWRGWRCGAFGVGGLARACGFAVFWHITNGLVGGD